MKKFVILLMFCALLALSACGESDETKDPKWQKGYDAGHDDGYNAAVDDICAKVKHDKDSIYDWMKEDHICPSGH